MWHEHEPVFARRIKGLLRKRSKGQESWPFYHLCQEFNYDNKMPAQKFVTIDVGSAWTKGFLVNVTAENQVSIEKSARLPTSLGDIPYAAGLLLSKIGCQEASKLFVSHLSEVEKIAREEKGDFVKEEESKDKLVNFLKLSDADPVILDGGAANLREDFVAENIGKFLTFPANEIGVENFLGNRAVRPHVLPKGPKELELEEAILRASFASLLSARDKNKKVLLAVSGGIISGTPRLSRVALLILDVLEKGMAAQVFFDREFFLPSFGALLTRYEQLQTASTGPWFESLGALISLGGSCEVSLDWGYSQIQQVETEDGEISLIPAPVSQRINLTFTAGSKEKKSFCVLGGSLGIILDARSKPLPLAFGQEASRHKVAAWQREIEKAEITKEAF